jgi:hypothetical protein
LLEDEEEKWSWQQQVAFGLSLAIIVYSYIGLLSCVFNLGNSSFVLVESLRVEVAAWAVIVFDLLQPFRECLFEVATNLSGLPTALSFDLFS